MGKSNIDGAKKFDLHVHSKHSKDINSREELSKILKTAKKRGLGGIAITDHNNALAFPEIAQLQRQDSDFLIVKGEEVMVIDAITGKVEGELLCYFLQEEIRPACFDEIIDSAKSQGALISIAHPFDNNRVPFAGIEEKFRKVHAIEGFNSRVKNAKANELAAEFAARHGMPMTAGSDAHSLPEIGRAGIECNAASEEELRKAILRKECRVFGKRASALARLNLKAKAAIRRIGALK